jgi:hypothetical protein
VHQCKQSGRFGKTLNTCRGWPLLEIKGSVISTGLPTEKEAANIKQVLPVAVTQIGRKEMYLLLVLAVSSAQAFSGGVLPLSQNQRTVGVCCYASDGASRRDVLLAAVSIASTVSFSLPESARANSDKTVTKFSTQAPPTDKDGLPFTYLESGVGYR